MEGHSQAPEQTWQSTKARSRFAPVKEALNGSIVINNTLASLAASPAFCLLTLTQADELVCLVYTDLAGQACIALCLITALCQICSTKMDMERCSWFGITVPPGKMSSTSASVQVSAITACIEQGWRKHTLLGATGQLYQLDYSNKQGVLCAPLLHCL